MKICAKHIVNTPHESYEDQRTLSMPLNRVPSLQKIVQMFESGRPMDTTLDLHLAYNPVERMPCFRKGYDLADAYHDLTSMKADIDSVNEAMANAKANAQPLDTNVTPNPAPEKVE